MDKTNEADKNTDKIGESENMNRSALADIISLETVINVLVEKGVCTPEELFEAEQKQRKYNSQVKDISIVNTSHHSHSQKDGKSRRQRHNWLKRKMSQRRWTRRVGTRLFGWQWKKVKNSKHAMQIENIETNSNH